YLDIFSPRESKFVNPLLDLLRDNYDDTYEYGLAHIRLHRSTSKWPLRTPDLNYREFCNLHYLKFILPCFNSNVLLNVLQKCHKLQLLIIQSNKEGPSPSRTWEPQSTIVPKCLKSHLNHIHIEGYQGFEDELAFAEYILRNGLVLKTMLIFVDTSMDLTNKHRSLERLTHIPKGSVTCQLKLDAAVSP
ncbi:F-box/RNI/FBD-like domain protein, partial [Trifolium medium]|nr:F-box/RNI/FBD-like domain protein [Trifolium medium]